uniref:Cytokine dependent hematopoietic cell linker n=1 Tax=Loxodonta africana TaxID=9785 RepID=G3T6H7_LOXAF
RNFAAVLDGAKGHSDDNYEEPELEMVEAWQPIKILPARAIRESEYADTRYFKAVMDLPVDPETSVFIEEKPWSTPVKPEEEDEPISKDTRSQHIKGDKLIKEAKIPLPPPRPPIALPRKYQPLPPTPESSKSLFPQRHTFPEAWRGPRNMSLKNLREVLGAEEVPHHHMKPELSQLPQNQNSQEVPLGVASCSFTETNHSVQSKVHKGSLKSCSPQQRQSPVSHSSHNTSGRKPFPTQSDEKDVQHHDWYIGEYSRQAVEEALKKENKDGTFLVRDCSSKSKAEPYVLVVFYGNKVYNVKIRFLEANQQFALGTGLRGNKKFDSVEDIIEHYKYFPITLVDGRDKSGAHRGQCYLTQPAPLHRFFLPR